MSGKSTKPMQEGKHEGSKGLKSKSTDPLFLLNQTEDAFNDYKYDLEENRIPAAENNIKPLLKNFQSALITKYYKTCLYNEATATVSEYTKFKNLGAILGQDTTQIMGKVDGCIAQSTKLKEALEATVTAIKKVHRQMVAVDEVAGKVWDAIDDQCYDDQTSILLGKLKGFKDELKVIHEAADQKREEADHILEKMVKVSGVEGFTNVPNLKGFSDTLEGKVKAFNEDVDKNVNSATTNVTDIQAELTTALQDTSKQESLKNDAVIKLEGLHATEKFLNDQTMPENDLDEICSKVESVFLPAEED